MRRVVALPLALALLAAGCSASPRSSAGKGETRPKLVVVVVVDQLPTWLFERDRPLLTGGFARLLRDGAYVRDAELPYAHPFTAPGHATIGTGAVPSVHGVLGNSWYRRAEGRDRPAEYDVASPIWSVGPSQGGELTPGDTASGVALRVGGVADTLREATGGRARSIAISLKPRAAAFMAGRRPDLAVWYDAAAGGMTTSRAYASEPPRWLVELARTKSATRFFTATWVPLDRDKLARTTGIADDAKGEGAVHGLDDTFPHPLAATDAPARAFLHTPYADELVGDTALAALDELALGADDVPDLLALSFNAHDYAGHLWGPDSWEALDLMMRLDALLARMFDTFDARYGRDGWAVVVTSDHGATPVVERSRYAGARRIRTEEIADAVERAVGEVLGDGPWVAKVLASNVYMTPAFAEAAAAPRELALDAGATALAKLPSIAAAGRVDRTRDRCDDREGLHRAVCLSIVPGESGELFVVPAAGSLITDYRSGTHHDAPSDDNRRVPIFVMGPGIATQRGTGTLLQVAPTVAALLRIPPPQAATEKPLFGLRSR